MRLPSTYRSDCLTGRNREASRVRLSGRQSLRAYRVSAVIGHSSITVSSRFRRGCVVAAKRAAISEFAGQDADDKVAARRADQAAYPSVDVVDIYAFVGRGLVCDRVGDDDVDRRHIVVVADGAPAAVDY